MSTDRFRFRLPERDRESDEMTVRSAIGAAETEGKGLRARIAEAGRSAMFLVGHDGGPARAGLQTREQHPRTIGQRLAQLEDHLTALRRSERRLKSASSATPSLVLGCAGRVEVARSQDQRKPDGKYPRKREQQQQRFSHPAGPLMRALQQTFRWR
jgi:hypothetical protein